MDTRYANFHDNAPRSLPGRVCACMTHVEYSNVRIGKKKILRNSYRKMCSQLQSYHHDARHLHSCLINLIAHYAYRQESIH